MPQSIPESGWLWIIIQNPGKNEQIVGQEYEAEKLAFIPAFKDKEKASMGLLRMAVDPSIPCEPQAIHLDDLKREAFGNGFIIMVLEGGGEVIERILPETA